jgi:hypothetical protein
MSTPTNEINGVKVEDGEVYTFETRAEYDAFLAGIEVGVRIGNEHGWDDGYRPGDLVDVAYDEATLTATEKLAAVGTYGPGDYEVAVYYLGDHGEWLVHDIWVGHADSREDAEKQALDALEDVRIDGWKAEVVDFTSDEDNDDPT